MVETRRLPGQRGRADHAMRERVIASAHVLFRDRGFARTSVADIAAELEVAPTYLYKFFQSKNAIGEAVCGTILGGIDEALWRVARAQISPREKIIQLFRVLLKESVGMFFAERKLHDLVAHSLEQSWSSIASHQQQLRAVIDHILAEGFSEGVFARVLDPAETREAVFWSLFPFAHPRVLEQSIEDDLETRADIMARFCLRALLVPHTNKVTD